MKKNMPNNAKLNHSSTNTKTNTKRKFTNRVLGFIFEEAYKSFPLYPIYKNKNNDFELNGNSYFSFHLDDVTIDNKVTICFFKKSIKLAKDFSFIFKFKENKNFKNLFILLDKNLPQEKEYYIFLKKHVDIVEKLSKKLRCNFYSLNSENVLKRKKLLKEIDEKSLYPIELEFIESYLNISEKYFVSSFPFKEYFDIINRIETDSSLAKNIKKIDSILNLYNVDYSNLVHIRNNLNLYYFLTKAEQTFKSENKILRKKFGEYFKLSDFENRFYEEIISKKCQFKTSDKVLLKSSKLNNIIIKGQRKLISDNFYSVNNLKVIRNKYIDLEPFLTNNNCKKLYVIFMKELKLLEKLFNGIQLVESIFKENNLDITDEFYLFSDPVFVNKKIKRFLNDKKVNGTKINKNLKDKIEFLLSQNILNIENIEEYSKLIRN